MWGGNQNDIPFGWALCNGQTYNNISTPDLRGRFVLGYNNNVAGVNGSSTSGGQTELGTNARVDYTLCNTVGNIGGEVLHTLSKSEMPTHNHGGVTGEGGWSASATDVAVSLTTTFVADDSGNHTHTISNDGDSLPHNNIPPFYVLCYIMKCY
jgi:microcystin-dependent protein